MNISQNGTFIIFDNLAVFIISNTLFAILILTSVIFNFALLLAILASKDLHTATNIFVFNLAITDLYFSVVYVPIQLSMYRCGRATVNCNTLNYFNSIMEFLQAYFFIVIALNRCVIVCAPENVTKFMFTIKKSIIYCIILWITSCTQNVSTHGFIFNERHRVCEDTFMAIEKRYVPIITLLSVSCAVTILYAIIIVAVKWYKNIRVSQSATLHLNDVLTITKLTYGLFVAYILLLMPTMILLAIDPLKLLNPVYYVIATFVAQTDVLVTVIIYAGLNPQIKAVMKKMFCKKVKIKIVPMA